MPAQGWKGDHMQQSPRPQNNSLEMGFCVPRPKPAGHLEPPGCPSQWGGERVLNLEEAQWVMLSKLH